jgi:hypothetical protein
VSAAQRLERILDDGYLDGLEERSTAEIRALRDECEEEESGVSYARRIVQGKLDIVRAELVRRRDEGTSDDELHDLLDSLPTILRDRSTGERKPAHRAVRFLVPPSAQHHAEEAERIGEGMLGDLTDRSAPEMAQLVERLDAEERRLSALRHELFDRLDTLQAELTRRYKEGATDVSEVLPHDA